jgi:hypothetical protein
VATRKIATAGNTVVPALSALGRLGFSVTVNNGPAGQMVVAVRNGEEFVADDPVTVLGLVKLVEVRTWNWQATDPEIKETLLKYQVSVAEAL